MRSGCESYQWEDSQAGSGARGERRWKALKLKAERRYGELLGPADDKGGGRRTVSTTNSDRQNQHQARRVAAVKRANPEGFESYVTNDPRPSREGLLRNAPNHRNRPRRETA